MRTGQIDMSYSPTLEPRAFSCASRFFPQPRTCALLTAMVGLMACEQTTVVPTVVVQRDSSGVAIMEIPASVVDAAPVWKVLDTPGSGAPTSSHA